MLTSHARVLVAVSGGKDSSALLWHLKEIAGWDRYQLTLIPAVTTPLYPDPHWKERLAFLESLCASLGMPLTVLNTDTEVAQYSITASAPYTDTALQTDIETAQTGLTGLLKTDSSCFICSQLRRKALFTEALRQGCDTIALGHHLDDILTTALMNMLRHGTREGMEPLRVYRDGALRLIRPLLFVPEETIIRFCRAMGWRTYTCICACGTQGIRQAYRSKLEKLTDGSIRQKLNLLRGLYSYNLID